MSIYQDTLNNLKKFIPQKYTFQAEFGLARTKYLLNLLDNPQDKINCIHVAGTSGKGSTSYFMASLLQNLGLKVGLHVSPFVNDLRERAMINGELISQEKFSRYVEEIIKVSYKMEKSDFGLPTYFEVLTALAFYIFNKEKVDYAVIETGLGGLFDATNTINSQNKICVITKIGFDHTEILGNTLSKILSQKAGIIQEKNPVFALKPKINLIKLLDQKAQERNTKVNYISKEDFKKIKFPPKFPQYQKENFTLAQAVIKFVAKEKKLDLNQAIIEEVIKNTKIPGRFEIKEKSNTTWIIDGAHNPQKMKGLISSFKKNYPKQKALFILAFKKGKDYSEIISHLIPVAEKIIVTTFITDAQDLIHLGENPEEIIKILKENKFKNYITEANPFTALEIAQKEPQKIKIITGSFYLIGLLNSKIL